jgi:hypothetical protein
MDSFTPWQLYPWGNRPQYPLDRRLGGPQSLSRRYGEELNLTPDGIRTLAVQPVVRHYTDWADTLIKCSKVLLETLTISKPLKNLKKTVFWDVQLCRSCVNRRFGGTLKMEAIRYFETSVHTRSTQRHIPEDGFLHSHRCENLKSYLRTCLSFTEPKVSLPCSQKPASGSLSLTKRINSIFLHFILMVYANIILPFIPKSPKFALSFRFSCQDFCFFLTHACYMPHPTHLPWFNHPNNIRYTGLVYLPTLCPLSGD